MLFVLGCWLFALGAYAQQPRDLLAEIESGSITAAGPIIPIREGFVALPEIVVDGDKVHIHTQGLFVTDKHFFVTGRLERVPKRAVFLRFGRDDPAVYELVDITPPRPPGTEQALDHPGGLDFDGTHFWIPVAVSQANSVTAMLKIEHAPHLTLAEHHREVAFEVRDHVGAIACDQAKLYGATWDTKEILVWNQTGKLLNRFAQSAFVDGDAQWRLAVQDWKFVRGHLFAAGIDKFPGRESAQQAAIDVLRPPTMKRVVRIQLPSISGAIRPLTNEGMAWHAGRLYLLPDDLGRGARIWQFGF